MPCDGLARFVRPVGPTHGWIRRETRPKPSVFRRPPARRGRPILRMAQGPCSTEPVVLRGYGLEPADPNDTAATRQSEGL